MNINEYIKNAKKLTEELARSPEKAREFFVKLGTHNTDGALTMLYGGEYTLRKDGTKDYDAEVVGPSMGPKDPRPFGGLVDG